MILISEETVVAALPKFMQTLDDTIFRELEKIAKKRGISIQELIRAVIVPEWVTGHNGNETKKPSATKWNDESLDDAMAALNFTAMAVTIALGFLFHL